jgi:hypothetical protein
MDNESLSPEERHKIFLEEKARLEIRQELEGPKTGAGKIIGFVFLGLLGLVVVLAIAGKLTNVVDESGGAQSRLAGHGSEQSSDAIKVVRSAWYCSPGSEDNAAQLNLAIARKDMEAAAGHVSRNGAFQLETGTSLRVVTQGASSLVLVRVTSGLHDGEQCWLPANMTY